MSVQNAVNKNTPVITVKNMTHPKPNSAPVDIALTPFLVRQPKMRQATK